MSLWQSSADECIENTDRLKVLNVCVSQIEAVNLSVLCDNGLIWAQTQTHTRHHITSLLAPALPSTTHHSTHRKQKLTTVGEHEYLQMQMKETQQTSVFTRKDLHKLPSVISLCSCVFLYLMLVWFYRWQNWFKLANARSTLIQIHVKKHHFFNILMHFCPAKSSLKQIYIILWTVKTKVRTFSRDA